MEFPILSLVIWVPIVAGLAVLAIGDPRPQLARLLALLGSLAGLIVALPLWTRFDRASADFQFAEFAPWIDSFSVNYHLGIDGMSLLLILLNCMTTVLVVIAGWDV